MIFPYDITEYDIDVICSHISFKTGTPFHLVKQKKQISYLDSYLRSKEIDVNNIIIENNYIERNYSENYSEYYSRCFQQYPKVCSRIHFFKLDPKWQTQDLEELLNNRDADPLESEGYLKLKNGYLGFIVIRPIPNTFLDKTCLKTYDRLSSFKKNSVIKRDYRVSLFGMSLTIASVAFQEQDKVLSACATSALWSFSHATNHRMEKDIPSPGAITKLAKPSHQGHDRQFPNTGLSSYMIRRFINETGLEPEQVSLKELDSYSPSLLKEYSYSFISSKIPLICGITVFEECSEKGGNGNKTYRYKGDHAISILGYSLANNGVATKDINLISNSVDKIYAHDDRIGPFTRFVFKDNDPISVVQHNGEKGIIQHYLITQIDASASSEIQQFKNEIIVPNILILGLYHKVRINYSVIKNTAVAFNGLFQKFYKAPGYKALLSKIGFKTDTNSWKWDISLYEVNDFKKLIISSRLKNKIKYLTAHWPKYIWSIEVENKEKQQLFSLCFDATDIPQGKIFLDVLVFNEKIATLFQALSGYCEDLVCSSAVGKESNINSNLYLWGVINHLANVDQAPYSKILDEQYGEVRLPRYFKDAEIKNDSLYFSNDNRYEIYEESEIILDKNVTYLWLINEEGWLVLGEELLIPDTNNLKTGHVTLNKGRPGRVAGELWFDKDIWIINSKSGRYSGNYSRDNLEIYLEKAITKRFRVYLKGYRFQVDELY